MYVFVLRRCVARLSLCGAPMFKAQDTQASAPHSMSPCLFFFLSRTYTDTYTYRHTHTQTRPYKYAHTLTHSLTYTHTHIGVRSGWAHV